VRAAAVRTRRATCRGELKNNIFSGISLQAWLPILRKRFFHIEWRTYWHRVLFITFMACVNTLMGFEDWLLYGTATKEAVLNDRPVFILGHPRTGTTLLHNLMAKDVSFGTPTTFQVGFPCGFLSLEPYSWTLASMVDKTRPMDNMQLSLDTPQEDELAVNVLSAGTSPYAIHPGARRVPFPAPALTPAASTAALAVAS